MAAVIATDAATTGAHRADRTVTLSDGRAIMLRTYGAPDGRPVIALHGTPGSRLKFSATDEPARRLGLRIIAPDRWGYGGTAAHAEPSLGAFAEDMSALAAALGIVSFAVMAVSGGGPYAAALAACYPERVTALALFAPVGPIAGVEPTMTPLHRFCFGPLTRRPRAVRGIFRGLRGLLRLSPRLGIAVAMATAPPADRRVLASPGVRDRLAATFVEGLRPGAEGPAIDLALFGAPWDLDLGAARVPARVWLGSDDRNVPLAAARHLAAALPDCEVVHLDGAGHLWVALNYDVVLRWIATAGLETRTSA